MKLTRRRIRKRSSRVKRQKLGRKTKNRRKSFRKKRTKGRRRRRRGGGRGVGAAAAAAKAAKAAKAALGRVGVKGLRAREKYVVAPLRSGLGISTPFKTIQKYIREYVVNEVEKYRGKEGEEGFQYSHEKEDELIRETAKNEVKFYEWDLNNIYNISTEDMVDAVVKEVRGMVAVDAAETRKEQEYDHNVDIARKEKEEARRLLRRRAIEDGVFEDEHTNYAVVPTGT